MPRYYCEYCDAYLTHDSASVRKTHNSGKKHKDNVRAYYQEWYDKNYQKLVESGQLIPGQGFVGTVLPVGGLDSIAGPGSMGGGRHDHRGGPGGLMGNRPHNMPPNMPPQFAQMMAMGMSPYMMPPGMMPPGMPPGMMPPGMMMPGMMPGGVGGGSGDRDGGRSGGGSRPPPKNWEPRDRNDRNWEPRDRNDRNWEPRDRNDRNWEPRDRNDRNWEPPRRNDRRDDQGAGGMQQNGQAAGADPASMGGIHPSRLAAMQRAMSGMRQSTGF